LHPPDLYLKLNINDLLEQQTFSILVPIYFDELKKTDIGFHTNVTIDLGTIYFNEFIYLNETIPGYAGIHVNTNREPKKYKRDEMQPRPTGKLMHLKKGN
jgi:hypothetical protein